MLPQIYGKSHKPSHSSRQNAHTWAQAAKQEKISMQTIYVIALVGAGACFWA
jgi:hypothetical protein